ncbi:MAG: endonuclease/exonuclease/phosphatase family protein [Nocardioides sp.]
MSGLRIATWNVNSVRSRIGRVEALVQRHEIDVLCLQETKARDDQWPVMGLEAMGYEVATLGHSQWNGVAIASRVRHLPLESIPGVLRGRVALSNRLRPWLISTALAMAVTGLVLHLR